MGLSEIPLPIASPPPRLPSQSHQAGRGGLSLHPWCGKGQPLQTRDPPGEAHIKNAGSLSGEGGLLGLQAPKDESLLHFLGEKRTE